LNYAIYTYRLCASTAKLSVWGLGLVQFALVRFDHGNEERDNLFLRYSDGLEVPGHGLHGRE